MKESSGRTRSPDGRKIAWMRGRVVQGSVCGCGCALACTWGGGLESPQGEYQYAGGLHAHRVVTKDTRVSHVRPGGERV